MDSNLEQNNNKIEDEFAQPDDRFFLHEQPLLEELDEKVEKPKEIKKVFNNEFKKRNKKEQRIVLKKEFKRKFLNALKFNNKNILLFLDKCLLFISVICTIIGALGAIKYLIEANPIMVGVSCLFIVVSIYWNEKIS